MNNMMKLLMIIICVFVLTGCFATMGPSEKVENMMSRYIKNDKEILNELDRQLTERDLTKGQISRYKEIVKNEYSTIKYDIKDEKINGDEATVEMNIEVKDLYKASKKAGDYLFNHAEEFYTDGVYDESKFKDYKLSMMEEAKDTVKYTIYVNLVNEDGIWTIRELDNDTLEKIHGIYDYESA